MLKYIERSPKEMMVITKAKDLLEHSFNTTANTERFPKKYRFSIGARIENISIEIYENLVRANEYNLADPTEKAKRLQCQQQSIVLCKLLNTLIELAYKIKSIKISSKSVEYWCGLVVEVKRMSAAWRNNDKKQ